MSRANVRVRPAGEDDVPAVAHLVHTVDPGTGVFSGKPMADAGLEHLTERLGQIVADGDRAVLIATDEAGEVVGMLASRTDEIGAIDLTPVLHVTHLMVRPDLRRRGIGRALLAAAVNLAEEYGVESLLSTSAAGSREANRYLARLGFAPLVVHRVAPLSVLRRSLGMTDVAGRMVVLRRARMARAQRSGFAARAVGRGA